MAEPEAGTVSAESEVAFTTRSRVVHEIGDAVLQLDNFVALRGYGWKGFRSQKLWRQDKGQLACASAFLECIRRGTQAPISPQELFEVARVSIHLATLQRDA